jgi:hypothetical protein
VLLCGGLRFSDGQFAAQANFGHHHIGLRIRREVSHRSLDVDGLLPEFGRWKRRVRQMHLVEQGARLDRLHHFQHAGGSNGARLCFIAEERSRHRIDNLPGP